MYTQMEMVSAIELFTAINFFVIGLSHFLKSKAWVEFFIYLHSKGHAGNIVNALIALATGSLILSFHLIWQWPKLLITVYGLLQTGKGLLYLVAPSIGIASIGKVSMERAAKFWWAGLVMFLISLVIICGMLKQWAFL